MVARKQRIRGYIKGMQGQVTKQKMCWNCEERVDFGVENCPSCGVYLSTSPLLEQSNDGYSNNSYIAPPYRLVSNEQEHIVPDSPYASEEQRDEEEDDDVVISETLEPSIAASLQAWKTEMIPMLLLLCGTIFSLFGVVLLLFSENGSFTLKWNGDYWYVYLLLGLPFVIFGWKALDNVQDTSKNSSSEGNPHNTS